MTKRARGRPLGYVAPGNCPVTDPEAFVMLFRLLRDHAAEQPRGGASWLAHVLDVSHVLVVQYCRRAPRGIAPALFAALERAPLMLQRYPFPFDDYFSLLERAVEGEMAEGTPAPHTSFAWLPAPTDAVLLSDLIGPVVHNLRRTGRISHTQVSALPGDRWIRCTVQEAEAIRAALPHVKNRRMVEQPDGDNLLILLQATP